MSKRNRRPTPLLDKELVAMKECLLALRPLKTEEAVRTLQWLGRKLNIPLTVGIPLPK
jgi:hypothetical protein